jgi:GNAT superfamily N-acetyltransferase
MLFTQYEASLGTHLTFQNFAHKLVSFPGLYSVPTGCIILVYSSKSSPPSLTPAPIGYITLRPLSNSCEMEPLYCAPEARKPGAGKEQAEAAIKEVKSLGYAEMRWDTLPSMTARRLCEKLAFVEIELDYGEERGKRRSQQVPEFPSVS